MPIVRSWTDGIADTRTLLRFRLGTVRGDSRRRLGWAAAVAFGLTLGLAIGPSLMPDAGAISGRTRDVLVLMPAAATVFLLLTGLSAVSAGGGRELIARENAVPHPIGPITDHLGALAMAPLNIAWLIQAWTILAMTAYAVGPATLLPAQLMMLLFLASATALGQLVGWLVELIRRGPGGRWIYRALVASLLGVGAWMVVTERVVRFLEVVPTVWLAIAAGRAQQGDWATWLLVMALLPTALVGLVLLGALPAAAALRRLPRDEARLESGHARARRDLRSDFLTLARVDLGSVLRSVPLRRGVLTLALLPGLAALAAALDWSMVVLLPGLVASGVALLFGVNAWCLDGRGALWRESLPVDPRVAFAARVAVLTGLLLSASAVAVLLAAPRAGVPSAAEVSALLCAWLVVTTQVVAASMRWSQNQPFAVDLRSARATPAPPVMMVGYSARLALGTTLMGMFFSLLARTPWWGLAPVVAAVMLAWLLTRLGRSRRSWADDQTRSGVVVTVAA